ncbi:MAG: efflux RND transporter permease subunit, partial [Candidatus Omnitrophota bacterium]
MNRPRFSINRPVTTVMIFAGIMLFGFISLTKLPQELFPPITYPQLTVVTTYENAAPEEIETLITKPVEESIGTVSGLRRLRSVSKEGLSLVIAEFGWAQNMDFAALRMREKIDLIKERLPRESEEPLVMKYNPFEMPVMTLSVTGQRPPQEIREISRRIIK